MADKTLRVRLEAVTDKYSAKMRQAAAETRTHGSTMARSARENRAEWTTAGLAIGAAGAAITLGLRKAGNEAAAFQGILTRSTTLIGISTDEMQAMGRAALGMADTGRGPQELGRALFFAQSAGLRGSAALDVVEASAKAAAIGLGDTATVTDLVTSAVNAYGSEVLSASGATDVLIGAVREGKAEASELAGAMGVVLPVASAMGVSFDQVGGAMAAMTRTGTNVSMAATQLRAMLVALLNPAQGAEEAMNQVGLSSEGLRQTIQDDGLFAALMQVRDAVGDNDAAMAAIFPNIRALAGVMDLTGANSAETARIFERMTDTTGLLSDGFAEWSKTTEASQARFSASMEAARIALGEGLQPAMRGTLDVGTGLAQMFVDLPEGLRQVVAIGGGAAGVTATLAGAFLLLLPRVLATRDAMRTLNLSFGKLALNPYVLAIGAAVTALSIFARKKAETRAAIDEWRQTLDQATGAVTDATRALALQRLQDDGAIDAARTLGLSMETLVDAALGVPGAMGDVETATAAIGDEFLAGGSATREQWEAARLLLTVLGGMSSELGTAADKARDLAFATLEAEVGSRGAAAEAKRLTALAESQGGTVGETADALDGYAGSLDDVEGAADDTRTSLERLSDVLDELIGVNQTAERANIALLEGWEDLTEQLAESTEVLDENGEVIGKTAVTLDVNTEAGRNNRKAILDQVDAIKDDLRARHDQGDSLADIAVRYDEQVDKLKGVMRQAGLTEDEVADYIDTLGLTPEQVVTAIIMQDQTDSVFKRVMDKIGKIPTLIPVNVRISQTGGARLPVGGQAFVVHGGGEITGSGVRRFHGGGASVGHDGAALGLSPFGRLAPDEMPAILQTGEWVLSRQQVALLTSALGSAMRLHSGGVASGAPSGGGTAGYTPPTQIFYGDVPRQTQAEARHQARLAYLETR